MLDSILKNDILNLISKLNPVNEIDVKAIMGFDGFVDQILHAVETRENAENYTRMKTLKDFGDKISKAAGLSTSVELVPIKSKLGGNGPIMANALTSFGLDLTYIGALGVPSINAVFEPMHDKCKLISIANPGQTDAVEFLDGKLMIGKREALKDVKWDKLKEIVGLENLIELVNESQLIGLENWTMLPYMTDIWRGMLAEVLPHIDVDKEKYIFFDLADPENRLKADILEALSVIQEFSSKFKVILGLNLKEAIEIGDILEVSDGFSQIELKTLATEIAKMLNIYCLVVHPVKEAVAVCSGEYFHTLGPFEPNPKLTTGAGDNFNAGFCLGEVLGLTPKESLIMGTAASGFYVRNAASPTFHELIEFLNEWIG
ncbi:carbohydrate kinase family protein [Clostridium sp.]|uniref:carbohydrate kinase family protein n=1 Tax=Clostridium sp. TaxID=1506 RepID=UPI0028496400|nr:carbohydrate kinase family protein [Clostridium sp.]MDR3597427.1 carbohydrate kinase family protein [Clostridium sp.]